MAEHSNMADLTDDDYLRLTQAMRALVKYPEWEVYVELLKDHRVTAREALVDGDADSAQLPVTRGIVKGLYIAEAIPAAIVARGEAILRRRQSEPDEPDLKRRLREGRLQPADQDSTPTFGG